VASLLKKGILEFSGPAREGDFTKDGQKLALANTERLEPPKKSTVTSERKTRDGTKQAMMIELLKRPGGATLAEIVEATGWQAHTVRGAMAGALKKKLGLTITSEKDESRGRVYKIA
jgi:hypothetical protein